MFTFLEYFRMLNEGFMNSKYRGKCSYSECPHANKMINVGDNIFWQNNPKIVMHTDCYKKYIQKSTNTTIPDSAKIASSESKPVLSKIGNNYICRFQYDPTIKDLVKEKGFRWNPDNKVWYTTDPVIAARLIEYADDETKNELEYIIKSKQDSRNTGEDIENLDANSRIVSPEGMKYLPFQEAGIRFAMQRDRVLIADEMGLGKTIQAIGYINMYDKEINNCLIICPQKLKYNWKKELEKWLVSKRNITVVDNKRSFPDKVNGIVILNYDIIYDLKQNIDSIGEWDLLIADEAHYIKNQSAKRSAAILGTDVYNAKKLSEDEIKKPIKSKRAIFMTGTPIDNKPQDLFALLNYLDPNRWNNYFTFIMKYCGGYKGRYGLEFRPPTNKEMESLQDILRSTIMIRRLKKDVLKDLPPKTRSIITYDPSQEEKQINDKCLNAIKADTYDILVQTEIAKSSEDLSSFTKFTSLLDDAQRVAFDDISKNRSYLGLKKVPHIIKHAENVLKTNNKIIIFAHHRNVIDELYNHFGDRGVKLVGGMAAEDVTDIVDEFQSNPNVNVFIGSILASATGLTLTSASTVIFGEFDWRPTTIIQAEDRAHRIGQKKNVDIHYIVAKDSIDELMVKSFINKASVNDKILDNTNTSSEEVVFITQPLDVAGDYVTKNVTPEEIRKESNDGSITPEVISACIKLLNVLASWDTDNASEKNNMGFNKIDGHIGKSLASMGRLSNKQAVIARKLCNKYRKQLSSFPELKIVLDSMNKTSLKESTSIKELFKSFLFTS